jgi:hypothetical protein
MGIQQEPQDVDILDVIVITDRKDQLVWCVGERTLLFRGTVTS